jgi:mTERF domain-containing protein, mitochondrial
MEHDVDDDFVMHNDDVEIISNNNNRQDFFDFGPDAFLDDGDLALLNDVSCLGGSSPSPSSLYLNNENAVTASSTNTKLKISTTGIPSAINEIPSLLSIQHLASDLSYFYLSHELGLSEEAMWKITDEAGSVLGMYAHTIQTKVNVLRSTMGLTDEELRHVITSQPTLLQLSARKNLSPKILFLIRQLDLGRDDLKRLILGWPGILAYSMPNLKKKIHFFKSHMGYTMDECRTLLCREPKLLTAGVDTGLLPRLKFLVLEMEFGMEDVKVLCQKYPSILLKSLDDNLRPKLIFFFILTLSMTLKEVKKMVMNYPSLLDYNLEDHVRPITEYLLSLEFSPHEIARMLLKFPRLVTHSLVKIKHVVGYLRFQLGLEATHVRRILYQAPQVVGLTTANLQAKVDFLESVSSSWSQSSSRNSGSDDEDISSSATSLRKVIVGMPTLLLLSVDTNLSPKVHYLRERLGAEELFHSVHRLPTLLGYSLEKRIRPRLEAILAAGVDGSSITIGIPMSQDKFEAWLQGRTRKAEQRRLLGTLVVDRRQPSQHDTSQQDSCDDDLDKQTAPNQIVEDGGRIVHWTRGGGTA